MEDEQEEEEEEKNNKNSVVKVKTETNVINNSINLEDLSFLIKYF